MTNSEQTGILKEWLGQYKGLIYKIVRAYEREPEGHSDLFQEITIQVWHSIPTFKGESAVTTWIYRIALNTAIKWKRKTRKHEASQESLDSVMHSTPVPESQSDELTWLYEEIQKLDKIDRSLTLLLLDDFSYKEMAVMLGISESNVGVKINRIKKYLINQSKKV